jgi:hypothetical protein
MAADDAAAVATARERRKRTSEMGAGCFMANRRDARFAVQPDHPRCVLRPAKLIGSRARARVPGEGSAVNGGALQPELAVGNGVPD